MQQVNTMLYYQLLKLLPGTIAQSAGSGRKTLITEEVKTIVEQQM